jgi:hypothetical protein
VCALPPVKKVTRPQRIYTLIFVAHFVAAIPNSRKHTENKEWAGEY